MSKPLSIPSAVGRPRYARWWTCVLVAIFYLTSLRAADGWLTDLPAARAQAKLEGKNLLIDFTGSKWCPPCIQLHKQVMTSPEFRAFSKNLVLVTLDFPPLSERTPEKIAANPALAQLMKWKSNYAVTGFPTVVLLDPFGKELAKAAGYGGELPAAYLAKFRSAK